MSAAKKLIYTLKDIKTSYKKVSPMYLTLVEIFPLLSITSKNEHEEALAVVQKLILYLNECKMVDSGAQAYLATLVELVGHYERNHCKTSPVTGAEMLAYLMALQGLNQSDLSKELGGQSVVSKILKGERELNLRQIKALSKRFRVSPQVFI